MQKQPLHAHRLLLDTHTGRAQCLLPCMAATHSPKLLWPCCMQPTYTHWLKIHSRLRDSATAEVVTAGLQCVSLLPCVLFCALHKCAVRGLCSSCKGFILLLCRACMQAWICAVACGNGSLACQQMQLRIRVLWSDAPNLLAYPKHSRA